MYRKAGIDGPEEEMLKMRSELNGGAREQETMKNDGEQNELLGPRSRFAALIG